MPSSSKKRRNAAKKRRKELGVIQPDSPTNIPQATLSNASVEKLEGSALAETSSKRKEENAVPFKDAVSGLDDSGEHGPDSGELKEAAPVLPPYAACRASWMSCCGFLDILMGSRK